MAASAPLARIVERCLEKEPARRYASGKELLADLRALAGGAPATRPRSRSSLIEELKRRRVFRAILAYGVFAFAILQVVEPIMHGLHWPDAVLSYVVVALGLGFPAVVGLAWAFDVREGRIERAPAAGTFRRPGLVPILAGLGLLAAAPGLIWYFVSHRRVARSDAERSVAVLPFNNLSTDKDNEFFADGVQSELITQLTRVSGLKVIARSSVQQYRAGARDLRAIAEALGVATLVEGSVQRSGGRARITAQLVDVASNHELWSDHYDRDLKDTFAVQTEVALEVARALGARLTAGESRLVEQPPPRTPTPTISTCVATTT